MCFRLVLRVNTHLAISFFLCFSSRLLFLSRQLALIQPRHIKTITAVKLPFVFCQRQLFPSIFRGLTCILLCCPCCFVRFCFAFVCFRVDGDWVGIVRSCSPDEHLFTVSIVFRDDSTSQSLLIFDGESDSALYTFNGYGHDNSVFYDKVCLKSKLHAIVARDGLLFSSILIPRLRSAWPLDSYFSILTDNSIELFRGTCDFNGQREYEFYRTLCDRR